MNFHMTDYTSISNLNVKLLDQLSFKFSRGVSGSPAESMKHGGHNRKIPKSWYIFSRIELNSYLVIFNQTCNINSAE